MIRLIAPSEIRSSRRLPAEPALRPRRAPVHGSVDRYSDSGRGKPVSWANARANITARRKRTRATCCGQNFDRRALGGRAEQTGAEGVPLVRKRTPQGGVPADGRRKGAASGAAPAAGRVRRRRGGRASSVSVQKPNAVGMVEQKQKGCRGKQAFRRDSPFFMRGNGRLRQPMLLRKPFGKRLGHLRHAPAPPLPQAFLRFVPQPTESGRSSASTTEPWYFSVMNSTVFSSLSASRRASTNGAFSLPSLTQM